MSNNEVVYYLADTIPVMHLSAPLRDCLVEMNLKRLGFCVIVDDQGRTVGVFSDGDFRRLIVNINVNFSALMIKSIDSLMNADFKFTTSGDLAQAKKIMSSGLINELPHVLDDGKLIGIYRNAEIRA